SLGNGTGDSVFAFADTISVGDGNGDAVTGGDGTVTLGNGNNDVFNVHPFTAQGTSIVLGNGNGDVVNDFRGAFQHLPSDNTITVGNGNDTIYVGGGDTITVGTGHDSFVFQQTTPGTVGAVTVTGFDPSKDVFIFSNQLTTSVSYQDNT